MENYFFVSKNTSWLQKQRPQLEKVKITLVRRLPSSQALLNKVDEVLNIANGVIISSYQENLVNSMKQEMAVYIQERKKEALSPAPLNENKKPLELPRAEVFSIVKFHKGIQSIHSFCRDVSDVHVMNRPVIERMSFRITQLKDALIILKSNLVALQNSTTSTLSKESTTISLSPQPYTTLCLQKLSSYLFMTEMNVKEFETVIINELSSSSLSEKTPVIKMKTESITTSTASSSFISENRNTSNNYDHDARKLMSLFHSIFTYLTTLVCMCEPLCHRMMEFKYQQIMAIEQSSKRMKTTS